MSRLHSSAGSAAAFALAVAALSMPAPHGASAQMMPKQIVITSNRVGGAAHVMASGVASILTKYSGTGATVRPVGSAGTWVSMFKNKEIDFGLTSITELNWAYWGIKAYKGKASPVYTIAALGTPQTWAFMVAKDTGITTPEQFKKWARGKRLTHKWVNPVIDVLNLAGLANLGFSSLEEAGIKAVPVTSYSELARIWSERRVDILGQTIGVPTAEQQNIARPIRYISMIDGPAALARMQKVEPAVYLSRQRPGVTGIDKEISALTYDYCLVARNTLEPAVVEKVLDTLRQHQKELVAIHPLLRGWGPAEERWVGTRTAMPYHPGAVAYYKKSGMWGQGMDARQAELVSRTPRP